MKELVLAVLFLVRQTAVQSTCAPVPCPEGWKDFNGYCYFPSPDRDLLHTAVINCINKESNIVSILSKAENDFVQGLYPGLKSWIGLTDFVEGTYKWIDNAPLGFTAWGLKQPLDLSGDKDCVSLSNNLWYTDYCDDSALHYTCKKAIKYCDPDPCQNGGTCVDEGTSFKCDCPPEFTGQCCEKEVPPNLCEPSPCHNHATCIMQDETFICKCPPGFIGRLCQNRDCGCMNGGMCLDGSCQCQPPWFGERCQLYKEKKKM